MSKAEQYAAETIMRHVPYWRSLKDGTYLYIPIDVVQSYMATAYLDGAISQIREGKVTLISAQ